MRHLSDTRFALLDVVMMFEMPQQRRREKLISEEPETRIEFREYRSRLEAEQGSIVRVGGRVVLFSELADVNKLERREAQRRPREARNRWKTSRRNVVGM